MRRKIPLLVIIAFIAVFSMINHGCTRSGGSDSDGRDDILGFDPDDPKIKERLGEDDGYALAIMYGGDIHGSLETCG